jgi:hypothetical protein
MKRSRVAAAAVAVSLLTSAGYSQSPAPGAPAGSTVPSSGTDPASVTPTAKMSGREMLNAALQPVQQQVAASLQVGVGLLFNRLFSALGASNASLPAIAAPAAPNYQAAQAAAPTYGAGAGAAAYPAPAAPAANPNGQPASDPTAVAQAPAAGYQPPPPAPPAAPDTSAATASGASALVPSVVYALDQVDPATFATIGSIDLSHGPPLLHTGDVFAIRYSTNVPGQVRIDNIDSAGVTNSLGTYTVVPGRDNRIPVTKGIMLTGVTGMEQFKMYFYPCVSDAGSGSSGVAAALPACSGAANPKLAMASKLLVVAKSATNLESPDPTIAVAATANYRPNDVTENDFALQHLPRQ